MIQIMLNLLIQDNILIFSDIISDDTLNSISDDSFLFKASIGGHYQFKTFLSLIVSEGYSFDIEVSVNNKAVQWFSQNSNEEEMLRAETFQFNFDLVLTQKDVLRNF